MAAVAVTRRESGSRHRAIGQLVGLTVVGWLVATAVHPVGHLLLSEDPVEIAFICLVVGAAAVWMGRRAWRTVRPADDTAQCGGCSRCPSSSSGACRPD